MTKNVLGVTTGCDLLRLAPEVVPALALGSRKTELAECLCGVILVGVSLKLRTDQSLHFLHVPVVTLADRHLTSTSFGADSSVYINNIHK